MSTLRTEKTVVLGSHQGMPWNQTSHWINAEQLPFERNLVHTSQIRKGKAGPTQPQGAGTALTSLFNQFHQLFPVVDLFKGQVFHRRAGDDQPVQGALGQRVLPADVQIPEVLLVPAFVGVGGESDPDRFDLQNRQPKGMQQVEFILFAQGHDVQNADPQGPDVLTFRLGGFDP